MKFKPEDLAKNEIAPNLTENIVEKKELTSTQENAVLSFETALLRYTDGK